VLWVWAAKTPWFGTPVTDIAPPKVVESWAPWAFSTWIVLRVIGSVVVVPVCEELAFRGFLLRRLIARDFDGVSFQRWTLLSLSVSSLAFGLLHERWLLATLCGVVYGLVQIKTGRLSEAIVAHATTNAVIATWALATGDWSVWN
jgi:CAAX prenyl protease-like protein